MKHQNMPENINDLIEAISQDKHTFKDHEISHYSNCLINLVSNANTSDGKLSEKDYMRLVIWANKLYDVKPQLFITLLSNAVGGNFDNANNQLYEIANKQGKTEVLKRLIDHSTFLRIKVEKANIVKKLISELDKHKQHEKYPDHIIQQLKNEILPNLFSNDVMNKTELDKKEYQSLLLWAARNTDESTLASIIDFTEMVNQERLAELKKLFTVAINQPADAIATQLYLLSPTLQKFGHEFNSAINLDPLPMLHCSLLQYSAAKNCPKLCKTLLDEGKALHADYFLNNCLHFAASSGNTDCYKLFLNYSKQHQLGWETQPNIFGHLPIDYLPENYGKLQRLEQNLIIKKIVAYIKLTANNKNPTFQPEIIQNGLCQGLSFFSALQTLKQQKNEDRNSEFINILLKWDGKLESLNNKLNNSILEKQDFKTINDAINYIANHALFLQHSTMINLLNMSKYDYASKHSFINQGKGKLVDVTDYAIPNITKQEIVSILQEYIATPNTLIAISLESDNQLLPTHAITITIDSQKKLHISDPNLPYTIPPFDSNDNIKIQALADIINNYNLNGIQFTMGSTYILKYEPAQSPHQKYNLSKTLLKDILKSKNASSPLDLIYNACLKDTPETLLSLLTEHKKEITDDHLYKLLYTTIGQDSYRCCDIIAKEFNLTLSDIEVYLAKNTNMSLGEINQMVKNYENYLINHHFVNHLGK